MASTTRPASFWKQLKKFATIGLVIIVVLLVIYLLFWYRGIMKVNNEASVAIPKAQKYNSLTNTITDEQNRCKVYVASGSGEFGQFEYCKRFLEWSSKLSL